MIPDHDPSGMMSSLNVDAIGQLEAVTVWVKVDHTYRGDLNVKLIHPSGAHVILFNRDGRNAVNLDLTKATPTFVGLDADGEWVLHVTDLGQGDEGVLVEWGLDILVPAEVPVVEK
jgi:subtilisin-like proprotein convertase family protein